MRTILTLLFCSCLAFASRAEKPKIKRWKSIRYNKELKEENPKLVASALCVLIGPFGGHRLYLGTNEKVPIAYTLTLGGGLGVLPVIDLFHIIFAKDLTKYQGNDKVIMWLNN